MRMPGFTAGASLYNRAQHYHAVAGTNAAAATGLVPALPASPGGPEWVDCNPRRNLFAYYCIECGSTGPGSIRCCRTNSCVVIDAAVGPTGGRGAISVSRPRQSLAL